MSKKQSPVTIILKSINNKGALLEREWIEANYVPFVINRALSYMPDCVLYAQELNHMPNMPVWDQYLFYYHSISRKSRFAPWHKKSESKYLPVVMEYYGYSEEKAKTALTILSEDDLKELERRINKGGMNNGKKRRI